MNRIKEVLEVYKTRHNPGTQKERTLRSVLKKACAANGFPMWEDAPAAEIKRDIFKERIIRDGAGSNTVKTYLYHLDEFLKFAGASGGRMGVKKRSAVDPALKSSWELVENAARNAIVIQKVAGYSMARGKHPREVDKTFLDKFAADCCVFKEHLAQFWNALHKKGVVPSEYPYALVKRCYTRFRLENMGKHARAFVEEWKKICVELGSNISAKRSSKSTGAGAVTLGYRKKVLEFFLGWFFHVKLDSIASEEMLNREHLALSEILEAGNQHHANVEGFVRYGEAFGSSYRTLDLLLAALGSIIRNYYLDPALDISRMRTQLKSKYDPFEIPHRYQGKIDEVELGDMHQMLHGLRLQRELEKDELKKAELCRDELITGLLTCHLLRRASIVKLRLGGPKPNFRRVNDDNGGKVLLVLYPEDHKSGRTAKTFVLSDALKDAHEQWVDRFRSVFVKDKICDSYFVKEPGVPITHRNVYTTAVKVTNKMLGVAINPHLFRHLLASKLIALDERNLIAVSKLLLHRSIDFTARKYLKYDERRASEKINAVWDSLK